MREPPYVLSMTECGTRVFVTIIDPEEKTEYNQSFSHPEPVVMQRNRVFNNFKHEFKSVSKGSDQKERKEIGNYGIPLETGKQIMISGSG